MLINAAQCGNLRSLLRLRFYVKSNLVILGAQILSLCPLLGDLKLSNLGNFYHLKMWKFFTKIKKSGAPKWPKLPILSTMYFSTRASTYYSMAIRTFLCTLLLILLMVHDFVLFYCFFNISRLFHKLLYFSSTFWNFSFIFSYFSSTFSNFSSPFSNFSSTFQKFSLLFQTFPLLLLFYCSSAQFLLIFIYSHSQLDHTRRY